MCKIENNLQKRFGRFLSIIFFLLLTPTASLANASATNIPVNDLGSLLPLWSVLPFAGILLSIALIPLFALRFWEHHFPKVSAFWALVFAVPFLYFFREVAVHEITHIIIIDYIPFILLLWALFTVSGGIHIKGSLKGTPAINVVLLFIGTILASLIGTTGASMLMIRPILRSNAWRLYKVHTVVFFIFLVSNIGGVLTPLGDPPLFLGFLHGVPFFWTLKLLPQMIFASFILLGMYFILDSFYYKKEDKLALKSTEIEPLKIKGSHNFIFLAGIIGGVLFSGMVKLGEVNIFGIHQSLENLIRDAILIIMGFSSLVSTKKEIR